MGAADIDEAEPTLAMVKAGAEVLGRAFSDVTSNMTLLESVAEDVWLAMEAARGTELDDE